MGNIFRCVLETRGGRRESAWVPGCRVELEIRVITPDGLEPARRQVLDWADAADPLLAMPDSLNDGTATGRCYRVTIEEVEGP